MSSPMKNEGGTWGGSEDDSNPAQVERVDSEGSQLRSVVMRGGVGDGEKGGEEGVEEGGVEGEEGTRVVGWM